MATNEAIAAFRREQALKNEAATRGLPVSDAPPDSQVVAAPDVSVETATDPAIDAFRQEQEDIKKLRPPEVEPQFDITTPLLRVPSLTLAPSPETLCPMPEKWAGCCKT